jgi:hypothetical protein
VARCSQPTAASSEPVDVACAWEVKQTQFGGGHFQSYLLEAAKIFPVDRPALLTIDAKAETVLVHRLTEMVLGEPKSAVFYDDHVSIPFPKTNIVGIRDKEHEVSISINRYDLPSNFILGLKREAGMFAEFSRRGTCNIKF